MMDIYEKMQRLDEIVKEAETIRKTLKTLEMLTATVNVQTADRCLMIAKNLNEKLKSLVVEAEILSQEIRNEMED